MSPFGKCLWLNFPNWHDRFSSIFFYISVEIAHLIFFKTSVAKIPAKHCTNNRFLADAQFWAKNPHWLNLTKKSRWMNILSVTVNLDRGLSSFTWILFFLPPQIKLIGIYSEVVNVTMPRQIWREYFTLLSMDMKTSFRKLNILCCDSDYLWLKLIWVAEPRQRGQYSSKESEDNFHQRKRFMPS